MTILYLFVPIDGALPLTPPVTQKITPIKPIITAVADHQTYQTHPGHGNKITQNPNYKKTNWIIKGWYLDFGDNSATVSGGNSTKTEQSRNIVFSGENRCKQM